MSHFILVHGSWHGGWCWKKLIPFLCREGHSVAAPDLPGHGSDRTPLREITMECYAEEIEKWVRSAPEQPILVGHSMAGGVISRVAERSPGTLRSLVYLAAYIPEAGGSIAGRAAGDSESRLNEFLQIRSQRGVVELEAGGPRECFYADCLEQDADFACERLRPEPLAPLTDSIALSEDRYGSVPRFYVECTEDRTVTPAFQRRMHAERRCRRTVRLETGHSPFLCAPERLAAELLGFERASSA